MKQQYRILNELVSELVRCVSKSTNFMEKDISADELVFFKRIKLYCANSFLNLSSELYGSIIHISTDCKHHNEIKNIKKYSHSNTHECRVCRTGIVTDSTILLENEFGIVSDISNVLLHQSSIEQLQFLYNAQEISGINLYREINEVPNYAVMVSSFKCYEEGIDVEKELEIILQSVRNINAIRNI